MYVGEDMARNFILAKTCFLTAGCMRKKTYSATVASCFFSCRQKRSKASVKAQASNTASSLLGAASISSFERTYPQGKCISFSSALRFLELCWLLQWQLQCMRTIPCSCCSCSCSQEKARVIGHQQHGKLNGISNEISSLAAERGQ